MSAGRMKDQADFDLERFVDMFDQALTSNDERVVNALRSLMMMVILTNPEDGEKRVHGPLKRMVEDHNHMFRRMEQIEDRIRRMEREPYPEDEYQRRHLQKESYKWPAQYPTWDVHHDLKSAVQKINGGLNGTSLNTISGAAIAGAQIRPQQIQPVIKKGK